MAAADINWTGKSGASYGYWITPIGSSFKSVAGNYIFAKETKPGYWVPVYIGETEDLNKRLSSHDKEAAAIKLGATHIHNHTTSDETSRLAEEKDLIQKWNPPLNVEHAS